MAFTDAEEAKLRTIISAYDEGEQIDTLELSDSSVTDKQIEVFDNKTGASGRMGLKDAVDMANAPYFGRVWDNTTATTKAATWVGSLEFGRNLADYLGLGGYMVKNDHTRRKLDFTTHYRFANGEEAKIDGSMGHYQWGWNKEFYVAIPIVSNCQQVLVSLSPIKGCYNYKVPIASMSASGFAALDRDSTTLVSYCNEDAQYRGGDNTSSYDDTYRTLLGRPVTNMTTEAFRAAARKNGSGFFCGLMRMNWAVSILFMVIFGNKDIQATYNSELDSDGLRQGGLGVGVTEASSWWSSYNGARPFIPMSVGADKGDFTGVIDYNVIASDGTSIQATVHVPCFFGLKHPWYGYLWRMMDDEQVICNSDTSTTHLVAPSLYGSWTIGSSTGMTAYSTSPTKGSGYISSMSLDNCENFFTKLGGTATTYWASYGWNNSGATSGFRIVLRGCAAVNGSYAGLFAVNVNSVVSDAAVYYGSPLCEVSEDWSVEPEYAAAA